MTNRLRTTCIAALVQITLFLGFSSAAYAQEPATPVISVTGNAEIKIAPDQVTLRVGIESRSKNLGEAVDEMDQKVAKVFEFLEGIDISKKDIRSELISIRPIYATKRSDPKNAPQANDPFSNQSANATPGAEETPLEPSGYVVQRNLKITTTQIERFEEIYRGLVERGMNHVDSIVFSTTKLREYRDRSRILAIRAAKQKAESLAGELGAKLAGVQSISESSSGRYEAAQNVSVSDPFGETSEGTESVGAGVIEIAATVHVVFRLGSTEFE